MGNSGGGGNSSIAVRTVRSVLQTGYICSSLFKRSPQLELFLIAVLVCRCRNFFLQDFLNSVHLARTSAWP